MPAAAQNPYDAVAYPGLPFIHTHPDRLAAMAILHGLSPAPVASCRVLEIACGEGANLIPVAYAIPGSEFVGFDLAGLPVERGQARVRELGLENVRVFQADLLDIGPELGRFDYIIAHGLYSWVAEPVRDRLLALCAELLTPDGIAFISYNALPGGYVRNAIRAMLQFCMTGGGDVERQVPAAMEFVRGLLAARPEGDAFRVLLEEHLDKMAARTAGAIFHDELSEAHHAVSFLEFAGHAAGHGLQYVCEAVLPPPPDPCYQFDMRSRLETVTGGDVLKQEQILDFVRARKYRETLLCRAERAVHRDFAAERFQRLLFASPATSSPGETAGATVFTLPGGIKMESNHPIASSLLGELEKAWPHALALEELESRLAATGFALNSGTAVLLTRLAVSKFVELRSWNAPIARQIPPRPKASAWSRLELRDHPQATTLLHSTIRIEDPIARRCLTLLDGTHSRAELAAALHREFPEEPLEDIEMRIGPSLEFFLRAGFLEA